MTPERFRQIEELYHAVREGAAGERAALLAQADPELRRAVESLLMQEPGREWFDRPAVANAPELVEDATQTVMVAGTQLGPYRIESKLGEGGMGEVFRAIDTRLGRAVAIKTNREPFNPRFEREARAISSLNHPNICTLYDVGSNYLVMELVEGETLAARLQLGPLPTETAMTYAAQIAAALIEAHSKGIVHRDLKPGNIMIGKSGVKILDFGLARTGQDQTVTGSHMIVGTPAYMAPEQREGKPCDARTDIYAFGCVLYEMLTASRAVGTRRKLRTRRLETIVGRCLEQTPERRWQSAAELQRELAAVAGTGRGVRAGAAQPTRRASKPAHKNRIVLAEFENRTGDQVFDGILRQGLAVQLEQSRSLAVVSEQQIQQVLRLMNRPAGTRLTPDVAGEICERTDGTAVLEGSITSLGNSYVLWVRARNCRTGDILGQEQAQAESREDVLNALTRIAAQIRARLGESLSSIREYSTPLEQATTSSLEALRAYTASRAALFARGHAAATPDLERAIAIDPNFAAAHADLGFFLWNMGQTDAGAEHVRKAYELRDRVSDRERRFIVFLYDREVTGNLQKELETIEAWVQAYPSDFTALGVLGGWGARGTGQYERGIEASEEALRINPDVPFPYDNIALLSMALGRLDEAANALKRAAERNLENGHLLVSRYYLAFLQNDEAAMKREVDRSRANLEAEGWMLHNQALVLARSGRLRNAAMLWQQTVEMARKAGNRERAAIYRAAQAVCEAHAGAFERAKESARAALELGKGRDIEYAAAYALVVAGDQPAAQALAGDLAHRFPEDTPVQFEYLPTLGALFALARRAPLEAIERLQTALPYDLAMPGTAFFAKFGGLYPAYIRGQAWLGAGRGREAAAEFQKVLDHRGIVLADPIGALAHLQLGRALASSGKMEQARAAYREFLALWKDADPDLPVLEQAREEWSALRDPAAED